MSEPTGDEILIAELEAINNTLLTISGKLDTVNSSIDQFRSTNDSDLDSLYDMLDDTKSDINTDFEDISTSIGQLEDTYCNNSLVIISYLDIFLVTGFVVLGIIFVCKFGKWIEFLFSDR